MRNTGKAVNTGTADQQFPEHMSTITSACTHFSFQYEAGQMPAGSAGLVELSENGNL
jgi:hypothetical protein